MTREEIALTIANWAGHITPFNAEDFNLDGSGFEGVQRTWFKKASPDTLASLVSLVKEPIDSNVYAQVAEIEDYGWVLAEIIGYFQQTAQAEAITHDLGKLALASKNIPQRCLIIDCLGQLKNTTSLYYLSQLLEKERTVQESEKIIEALDEFKSTEALELLVKLKMTTPEKYKKLHQQLDEILKETF